MEKEKNTVNTISIAEQKDGSFKLSCDSTYIPLSVAQEIVNNVVKEYKERYSEDELINTVDFLQWEVKHYKRLWIAETLLYVLMLILFALKANGVF